VFLLIEVMNSLRLMLGLWVMRVGTRQEVCTDGLYGWR
jgi:hypothetical protein